MLDAILGYLGQQDTNASNEAIANQSTAISMAEAQRNREFQERLSNSAYQRQVADLSSAGLNPMLAYIKGGGASTPSGSTGQVTSAQYTSPIQGALSSRLTSAQVDQTKASTRQTSAQTEYLEGVQTDLSKAELKKVEQATDLIKSQIDQIKGDTHFETQQNKLKATAYMLKQQGDYYQEQGMTSGKQRAVMEETINNLKKDGQLKQFDINAAKAFDNFGRTSKELLPVIEIMKSVLLPRGIR